MTSSDFLMTGGAKVRFYYIRIVLNLIALCHCFKTDRTWSSTHQIKYFIIPSEVFFMKVNQTLKNVQYKEFFCNTFLNLYGILYKHCLFLTL